MIHCLCLTVTSRALSSVGDVNVLHVFVKSYVSSDELEGSSVMYSVVDKLFNECFNGDFVFVP